MLTVRGDNQIASHLAASWNRFRTGSVIVMINSIDDAERGTYP